MGAKYVLLLGKDEQETNSVTIKDMQTGKSSTVKQAETISFLKRK